MPARSMQDMTFHDLSGLSRAALRARWRELFKEEPPAGFGRELLGLGIAYFEQEQQLGGLSRSRTREIDRLFGHAQNPLGQDGREPTVAALRPGTVLVREWLKTAQEVTVLVDGYRWNGQHYNSLSGIAYAITGTKWNGPRFFGLREARRAI